MKNKGFTLIELLVVVLIIGILAAIAVPQYQVAVGKSRFSTIKNITKSLIEACEVYKLANGQYPQQYSDLDITLPGIKRTTDYGYSLYIAFTNGDYCEIWHDGSAISCGTKINNITTSYYVWPQTNTQACYAFSTDTNDLANKVCRSDTGNEGSSPQNYYYLYFY